MLSDTIAAISTAVGESGIAVIRVSGPESIGEVGRVFRAKVPLPEAETHTVHYGFIVDPQTGEKLEEVLVSVFRAPPFVHNGRRGRDQHTRRDHLRQRVMDLLLLQPGIRLAEPGEFTKRAFLNGRIDLSQAEAVIDLIRSKSDRAFRWR
ncbi:hypothetical protein HMSSN036_96330 [Paenibacillus macerans]|nr:hypothetical protein HMSSN036_96330 [Paenibacillus macerans]